MKNTKTLLLTALAIAILDQLIKIIVSTRIQLKQSVPIISNVFHFTYTQNTGAGFGLFPGSVLFLILFSIAVIALIFYLLKSIPKKMQFAVGLILGGTIGNLIDRIRLGYVIDFFDFRIWPTFNIADSALTVGVFWLIILFILEEKRK